MPVIKVAEHCKTVIGENYSDYLDHLNELVVNKEKSWGNTLIPGYRDNQITGYQYTRIPGYLASLDNLIS